MRRSCATSSSATRGCRSITSGRRASTRSETGNPATGVPGLRGVTRSRGRVRAVLRDREGLPRPPPRQISPRGTTAGRRTSPVSRELRLPSLNRIVIAGNLTRDPEVRYTQSGAAVANIGLASSRYYKDPKDPAGEWKEDTCFVTVVAWAQLAERAGDTL